MKPSVPGGRRTGRPVIGLVSYGRGSDPGRYSLPIAYVEAVRRAGGRVVILPPEAEPTRAILEGLDGLVLPGGGDIDPRRYGQAPHPELYGLDSERDAFERVLAAETLRAQLPVLAICRGLQVVNVALGGDLVQHLPDVVFERVAHRAGVSQFVRHRVRLAPGSRLADVCGSTTLEVASSHHQGPGRLGARLKAVAWADDDTVEALEAERHPDLLAVQWHPEETAAEDERQQRLFDWLVSRARGRGGGTPLP